MKNLKLSIGKFHLDYPVIQGGMGVGISLGNLAGNVAKNGAIGVISIVDIGYREDDFYTNTFGANKRAFKKELLKAKKIANGNGIIAVNIMKALNNFEDYVKMAVEEKVDAIIVGAGLPTNLPEFVKNTDIMIAPIISSVRALKLIIKKWSISYNKIPDFIIVEGPDAGGHLGFDKNELSQEKNKIENLTKEIYDFLQNNIKNKIPFFSAGGIDTHEKFENILKNGATGVQIATPFILTNECDATLEYKKIIQNSTKEDLQIVKSPVGLWGRAIHTPLIDKINISRIQPTKCINCISTCNPKQTLYCISDALINAVKGNYENGLFFCGANAGQKKDITTVKNVLDTIVYG